MGSTPPASLRAELHRFGLARDRLREALCRRVGITKSELDALEHLEADGPLTQRELGDRLALTSGGVTLLVDRLEREGWLVRRSHPTDRRAVLLEVSRSALRELPAELEAYHAAVSAAARALSGRSRNAASEFLDAAARAAVSGAEKLRQDR